MIKVAGKTRRIIAFAMAFAMLYVPVAQAAGHCSGSCHKSGRYRAAGETGATHLHLHGIHSHTLSPLSILDPISQAPTRPSVDWIAGCKAKIGSATCTMASLRPFVALQGHTPEAARGHRLLTVSADLPALEMLIAQHINCRFEATRAASARAAPTPLFLKNLTLLI